VCLSTRSIPDWLTIPMRPLDQALAAHAQQPDESVAAAARHLAKPPAKSWRRICWMSAIRKGFLRLSNGTSSDPPESPARSVLTFLARFIPAIRLQRMKTVLMLWLAACYSNTTTTEYVDSVEPLLVINRGAYLSGPRTVQQQTAALQYFDQQWAYLKSPAACGEKILKSAGTACIADRSRNGKWPWEVWYRDSIIVGRVLP
jgi:hypothetical protein